VRSPALFNSAATNRLRGLCRLLPLLWTNTMIPSACTAGGRTRALGDCAAPLSTRTTAFRSEACAVAVLPNVEPEARQAIVESAIGDLRELVPEETIDVAAVLPERIVPDASNPSLIGTFGTAAG
jgi:hypothetical protein